MRDVSRIFYQFQNSLFSDAYTEAQIKNAFEEVYNSERLLLLPEGESFENQSFLYIPQLLDATNILLIDERSLKVLNGEDYENKNKNSDDLIRENRNRFDKESLLFRGFNKSKRQFVASYQRMTSLFSGDVYDTLTTIEDGTIIVIRSKNDSQEDGAYVMAYLAVTQNKQVIYVHEFQGEYQPAIISQLQLFCFMQRVQSLDYMPFFLKLRMRQIFPKGRYIRPQKFGQKLHEFHKIRACDVIETSPHSDQVIKYFSVRDIYDLLCFEMPDDPYVQLPEFRISISPYAMDVKPNVGMTYIIDDEGNPAVNFVNPIDVLLGSKSLYRQLAKKLEGLLSGRYKTFTNSDPKYVIINGNKIPCKQTVVEEVLARELLQQVANVLTLAINGMSQNVYLQDIAGMIVGGERYLVFSINNPARSTAKVQVTHITDFGDGVVEKNKFVINSDGTMLVRANNRVFLEEEGEYNFVPYDSYGKSTMIQCLYSYLTQYSGHLEPCGEIPELDDFIGSGERIFSTDNLIERLKRTILSYNSNKRVKLLNVPDYCILPKSYKDVHMDCTGSIDASWRPPSSIQETDGRRTTIYL